MKNKKNRVLLGAIAVIGLLRLADLFFNTDAATGLLNDKLIWLRYLILGLPMAAAFVLSKKQKPQYLPGALPDATLTLGYMVGAVGCIAGAVAAFVLFYMGQMGGLILACYILQAVGGLWLAALSRKKKANVWCGILLCVGLLGLALDRFMTNNSTFFRIGSSINVLAVLAAMMFMTRLLHLLEGNYEKKIERAVYFYGMTAFYLCCALFLPQQLWSLLVSAPLSAEVCAESISLAGIGLLGLLCALRAGTLAGEKEHLFQQEMQDREEKAPDTPDAE
ncbi:MAG: hypothetical protein Q4G07_04475 [Oscillospiraceae bacterium]|nr:hypothetical protein [Oscillospiraceae bacterium]